MYNFFNIFIYLLSIIQYNVFFRKQIQEVNTQQMDIQQRWDEKSRNIQTDCIELASENYKIRLASKRAEEEMIMYKLAKFK